MRQVPTRYAIKQPALTKQASIAEVAHVSAPLKGISLSSKLTTADPLTATILKNFVVEDDRIQCRAGYRKRSTHADGQPIWHLIPHYSTLNHMLAATAGKLADATTGTDVKTGFTANDWHWTSFSNLGAVDFTVMVNGADGVWSWDGSMTSTDPGPVAVTNLSKTAAGQDAIATVAAGDIGLFHDGDTVTIAGATGTGMTEANGPQVIYSVGTPVNTFTLSGVDTSAASGPQTSGVTADPRGTGVVKEIVTAPAYAPYIVPDNFQIVLSHMNRLWFADSTNLSVYYLPIQQKSGEVAEVPLNAVFKRGGHIRAMYTWTLDGGAGMDDHLVVFSSNGEAVIYSGIDPDSDFNMVGIYRFDSPMSKHSIVNWGGDLYALISTGLVPLSTMMRAETEQLGNADKNIVSVFRKQSLQYRSSPGWMTFINPSSGRLFCNIPQGQPNKYMQMIRHMPNPIWSEFEGVPARCWGWIEPVVYFGDDLGNVYEMHPSYLNDDGNPINVDVQVAWSLYRTTAAKQFKMVRPHITSDGLVRAFSDFRIDYDYSEPKNQPDVSYADPGAQWDVATWDVDSWAAAERTVNNWTGVATGLAVVGAPRLRARILNCSFSISGWDVIFERGNVQA